MPAAQPRVTNVRIERIVVDKSLVTRTVKAYMNRSKRIKVTHSSGNKWAVQAAIPVRA